MYQFNLTPYGFDMSHQEGTTKNTVLHKTAKMELSAFAPELFICSYVHYYYHVLIILIYYRYNYATFFYKAITLNN